MEKPRAVLSSKPWQPTILQCYVISRNYKKWMKSWNKVYSIFFPVRGFCLLSLWHLLEQVKQKKFFLNPLFDICRLNVSLDDKQKCATKSEFNFLTKTVLFLIFMWEQQPLWKPKHGSSDGSASDSRSKGPGFNPRLDPMRLCFKI